MVLFKEVGLHDVSLWKGNPESEELPDLLEVSNLKQLAKVGQACFSCWLAISLPFHFC